MHEEQGGAECHGGRRKRQQCRLELRAHGPVLPPRGPRRRRQEALCIREKRGVGRSRDGFDANGLGLDDAGRAALAGCDIVIHSAATVSFDSPLDSAVEVNLLGPTRIAATLQDLEEAIRRLPDRAREVFVLRAIYGYTHDEIAAMLGVTVSTSKTQHLRARRLLMAALPGAEEIADGGLDHDAFLDAAPGASE